MKIYLASSWKNSEQLNALAYDLRGHIHLVDCFCDSASGRHVFSFDKLGDISLMNNLTIREEDKVKEGFKMDKSYLDWCDCCVMLLPCGKSAHLEAGYAKGSGKELIIFSPGGFPFGDIDVMYGFADFITNSYDDLVDYLAK